MLASEYLCNVHKHDYRQTVVSSHFVDNLTLVFYVFKSLHTAPGIYARPPFPNVKMNRTPLDQPVWH